MPDDAATGMVGAIWLRFMLDDAIGFVAKTKLADTDLRLSALESELHSLSIGEDAR